MVQQTSTGKRIQFLLQIGHGMAKRKVLRQFDETDQVAAEATAMAVEQILARVDIERRMVLAMEGTESHELLPVEAARERPVVLPQIIQQGNALFEIFQIVPHNSSA